MDSVENVYIFRHYATQTAQALYLHRNTLLYRIHRIEMLTGLNLSLSDDLYKAAIALRIYSLLDMK